MHNITSYEHLRHKLQDEVGVAPNSKLASSMLKCAWSFGTEGTEGNSPAGVEFGREAPGPAMKAEAGAGSGGGM